ncbi:MAG: antitoxin VapB family protein, partial [Candidatus Aenigmatarchaeota archaeon]
DRPPRRVRYIQIHVCVLLINSEQMGTKTISLSEDAYDRLKRLKKENESFSDLVRRITRKIKFKNFHGILGEKAAEELQEIMSGERENHARSYENRIERMKKKLQG